MSRVQLALNVSDLEAAIDFYSTLFDTKPAKVKNDYANFAIDSPPLKLVLIANEGAGGSINHLGVEVPDTDTVRRETARLAEAGVAGKVEEGVVCCYAAQDKVWATGPDAERWEVYTVLEDSDEESLALSCC